MKDEELLQFVAREFRGEINAGVAGSQVKMVLNPRWGESLPRALRDGLDDLRELLAVEGLLSEDVFARYWEACTRTMDGLSQAATSFNALMLPPVLSSQQTAGPPAKDMELAKAKVENLAKRLGVLGTLLSDEGRAEIGIALRSAFYEVRRIRRFRALRIAGASIAALVGVAAALLILGVRDGRILCDLMFDRSVVVVLVVCAALSVGIGMARSRRISWALRAFNFMTESSVLKSAVFEKKDGAELREQSLRDFRRKMIGSSSFTRFLILAMGAAGALLLGFFFKLLCSPHVDLAITQPGDWWSGCSIVSGRLIGRNSAFIYISTNNSVDAVPTTGVVQERYGAFPLVCGSSLAKMLGDVSNAVRAKSDSNPLQQALARGELLATKLVCIQALGHKVPPPPTLYHLKFSAGILKKDCEYTEDISSANESPLGTASRK